MVSTLLRDPHAGPYSSTLATLGMLQPRTFGSLKTCRHLGLDFDLKLVTKKTRFSMSNNITQWNIKLLSLGHSELNFNVCLN